MSEREAMRNEKKEQSLNVREADSNISKRYIKELDPAHPVSVKLSFLDFVDIAGSGSKVEGRKFRVTRTYKSGSTKTHLLGICKKKKGVWKWVSLTQEGAELMKDAGFDRTLKQMQATEQKLVSELQKEWEIK